MFSDTITISINAVNKVLTRINQDNYSSEYYLRETTGEFRLRLRNSSYSDKARGGRTVYRHNAELVQTVFPAVAGDFPVINKMYGVFENENAVTTADAAKFSAGGFAFFSEANITKLLNFES